MLNWRRILSGHNRCRSVQAVLSGSLGGAFSLDSIDLICGQLVLGPQLGGLPESMDEWSLQAA